MKKILLLTLITFFAFGAADAQKLTNDREIKSWLVVLYRHPFLSYIGISSVDSSKYCLT